MPSTAPPSSAEALQLHRQAAGLQGLEIPQGLFAARQHHRIGLAEGFAGLNPAQLHGGFGF